MSSGIEMYGLSPMILFCCVMLILMVICAGQQEDWAEEDRLVQEWGLDEARAQRFLRRWGRQFPHRDLMVVRVQATGAANFAWLRDQLLAPWETRVESPV